MQASGPAAGRAGAPSACAPASRSASPSPHSSCRSASRSATYVLARNYLLDQRESGRRHPGAGQRPADARHPAPPQALPNQVVRDRSAPRATASPCSTSDGSWFPSNVPALQPGRPAGVAPRGDPGRPVGAAAVRRRRDALHRRRGVRRRARRRLPRGVLDGEPPADAQRHPHVAARRLGHRHRRRRGLRGLHQPPAAPTAVTRRRRGQRAGVGRLRHPARARARPRPRPARQLVQRHGRRRPEPHRARGPLRLRREPRAALPDHRPVGRGRGARRAAQRAARALAEGARRRRQPGAALRPDGARPPRDLPASTPAASRCTSSRPCSATSCARVAARYGYSVRAGRGHQALARPSRPHRQAPPGAGHRQPARERRAARRRARADRRRGRRRTGQDPRRGRRAGRARRREGAHLRAVRPRARRRATASAPASGWRSWPSTPASTADGHGWRTDRAAGRASSSSSPPAADEGLAGRRRRRPRAGRARAGQLRAADRRRLPTHRPGRPRSPGRDHDHQHHDHEHAPAADHDHHRADDHHAPDHRAGDRVLRRRQPAARPGDAGGHDPGVAREGPRAAAGRRPAHRPGRPALLDPPGHPARRDASPAARRR